MRLTRQQVEQQVEAAAAARGISDRTVIVQAKREAWERESTQVAAQASFDVALGDDPEARVIYAQLDVHRLAQVEPDHGHVGIVERILLDQRVGVQVIP